MIHLSVLIQSLFHSLMCQAKEKRRRKREKEKFLALFSLREKTEDSHMSYVQLRSCALYVHIKCFLLLLTTITPVFHLRFFTGKFTSGKLLLRSSIHSLSTWLRYIFHAISHRSTPSNNALHRVSLGADFPFYLS